MSVKALLLVLAHDGHRRAEILKTEVQHLCTLLDYRLDTTQQSSCFYDYIGGVYTHMAACAKVLQSTITEVESQAKFLDDQANDLVCRLSRVLPAEATPPEILNLLLTVNALRSYEAELVKSLAELHARFEQSLKYSIPDHPAPSVKSVRDSSIADRYYTELARFTYRDLIRFVSDPDCLNTSCPYTKAPRIFTSTGYQPNSRNHYFTNAKEHERWAEWVDLAGSPDEQRKESPVQSDKLPERFVSLRLPFWLPDLVEMTPILGHEIAHAVLTDLYGSLGGGAWLLNSNSPVSNYMYEMVNEFKKWIPGLSVAAALAYIQEITADMLALVRFKGAFLFAAVLVSLESQILSAFSNDEYDRSWILKYIKDVREHKDYDLVGTWTELDAKSFFVQHTIGTRNEVIHVLLRLYVLAEVTLQIEELRSDPFTRELAVATKVVTVQLLALIHSQQNNNKELVETGVERSESFIELARNFAEITTRSFGPAIEHFWAAPKNASKTDGWAYADYFLNRQRLSNRLQAGWRDYRNEVGYPAHHGDMASDIHWKSKWSVASAKAFGLDISKDTRGNLLGLAVMEDYLLRTMSSRQLFDQFVLRFPKVATTSSPQMKSKGFDEYFKGSADAGNHTDHRIHAEHVLRPSLEIGNYLKEGIWHRQEMQGLQWDRKAITGTDGKIEGSWPAIDATDSPYALSLYSAHALDGIPDLKEFKGNNDASTNCILLGRYDVATLSPLVGEAAIPAFLNTKCPAYVRRVVVIGSAVQKSPASKISDSDIKFGVTKSKAKTPDMGQVVGMMFIALASPMAWRFILSWIEVGIRPKLEAENIDVHFMLSDGWEHVIVLFERLQNEKVESVRLEPVTQAISEIREHPCVVRTETIFCRTMLDLVGTDQKGGRLVSVRFRCRANAAAPLSASTLRAHILAVDPKENKKFEDEFKGFSVVVRFLTGLTDFEIRVVVPKGKEEKRFDAIRFVHARLNKGNKISRLQSQVAF